MSGLACFAVSIKDIAAIALALIALMGCGVYVLVRAAAGTIKSTPRRVRASAPAAPPVMSLRDKWSETKPGARLPGRFGTERTPLLPDEL
jgi:hypothetical protein